MLYDPKWKAKSAKAKRLAKVYGAAADAIEAHGHSIGYLQDSRGRMCVWGAISFVIEGNAFFNTKRTCRALDPLSAFTDGENPIEWNNRRTRTQEEVVSMLRTAAREID